MHLVIHSIQLSIQIKLVQLEFIRNQRNCFYMNLYILAKWLEYLVQTWFGLYIQIEWEVNANVADIHDPSTYMMAKGVG